MADSTLDPTRDKAPATRKGHGAEDLRPGGSPDSGSDLRGPGLVDDAGLLFDTGTTPGLERSRGNARPDSDSGKAGTGARAAAWRGDDVGEARDIAPDRLVGSELPMPADGLDRIVTSDHTARDERADERVAHAKDPRKSR